MPFNVTLYYFLAPFDVLERADEWNVELNKVDINDDDQLSKLVSTWLLKGRLVEDFTKLHKWEVVWSLIDALSDSKFDFDSVFSPSSLDREWIALPTAWRIKDSRHFFWVIYQAHYEAWHAELAEFSPPTPDRLRRNRK